MIFKYHEKLDPFLLWARRALGLSLTVKICFYTVLSQRHHANLSTRWPCAPIQTMRLDSFLMNSSHCRNHSQTKPDQSTTGLVLFISSGVLIN